jgi:hypothetical protein
MHSKPSPAFIMVKGPFGRDQIGFVSFREHTFSLVLETYLAICQVFKVISMLVVAVALHTVLIEKRLIDNFLVVDEFAWT